MKYSTETEKDCDLIIKRYELGKIKIIEQWQYDLLIGIIIALSFAVVLR